MTNKVAFLVPSTTNKRDWKTIEDTYLWNILFKDLEEKTPTECDITVFVGYDSDDKIYHNMNERMKCNAIFKNFKIEWIDIIGNPKGNVAFIWNYLASWAVKDKFEYFKVLGDDITLPNDRAWLTAFINKLKKNNNIGWSGGYSNNDAIATQFLIHKTHLDIFGFVYAPEIPNWGCDNFLCEIYPEKYRNWLKQYSLLNVGGEPRYEVKWNEKFVKAIVKRHKPKFNRFLSNQNNN